MTPRRIAIVASELLGRAGTGGAGTADSLLALALGRHGHKVELLIASGRDIGALNAEWTARYESAGVDVRVLGQLAGVTPPYLAPPFEVLQALREDPPDVVIADDWRALAYAALSARQTGLGFADTAFVVHCHGPGRVLTEFARKVPDTLERFGENVAERTSISLADAVVSPSEWLLDWMRNHNWSLPESTQVVQYLRQSVALDEPSEQGPAGEAIRRIAFFGQLREGKGVRIFVDALATLEPRLLQNVELVFLGSARGRWTSDRVRQALAPRVREAASGVRFETQLERDEALAELLHPGTLAVMPSLLDNSPNTVAECIEHGIPFISTDTGGIGELVAESDRARVLCRPTVEELAAALTRALTSGTFAPAQPARDARESLDAWLELVDGIAPEPARLGRIASTIAVVASGAESARRAQELAQSTHSVEVEVVAAESRRAGLFRTRGEWVLFLDDEDEPDDGLLDTLVAAQAASGADVVTCALRNGDGGVRLFLGDPGALGLVENQYGVVGLVRSPLAVAEDLPEEAFDPDWLLFARLALAGATIVSIPEPLARHAGKPGSVADVPGDGLRVLEAFEAHETDLRDLPQLAATLAATLGKQTAGTPSEDNRPPAHALRPRGALLKRLATLARR